MAKIGNPRAASELVRAFDIRGSFQPTLEPFVQPVALVADLTDGDGLPIVRRCWARGYIGPGGAGQIGIVRLEIPGGVLAQLDYLDVNPTSSVVQVAVGTSFLAGGAASTGTYIDGRLRQAGLTPSGQVTQGTVAGGVNPPQFQLNNSFVWQQDGPPLVLGSGQPAVADALEFSSGSSNVEVFYSLMWTEYLLQSPSQV